MANSEKTLIEALQEASTFTDMRIYLYKSATIARWRDFSEICDQFPMALGLCHCATDGTAAIPAKLPELGSRQFVVEPNLEWVEIKQREKGHQVLGFDLSQRVVWF